MELCMSGHDEISWDGFGQCPACALGEEKDDRIQELEREVENLKNEIKEFESYDGK